jgi:proline iminopeptidase
MKRTLILLSTLLLLCCTQTTPTPSAAGDGLFPVMENPESGYLKVGDIHEIYYETGGNPEGKPVMCLHGGPGVGSYPRLMRYFDPEKFFMVNHDQRGSGRSRPYGELRENTTPNLVEDIEKLRQHLGLGKVLIFGGSWGSTLGLAYAEKYPENVTGMVLRGVFLGTEEEIKFHYLGTGFFFPEEQDRLLSVLPDRSRSVHPDYIHELVTGEDEELGHRVLVALAGFEMKFMKLHMPDEQISGFLESIPREAHHGAALIDLTYVKNRYFMEPGQLVQNLGKLGDMPVTLINGRYDMAAPPMAAYRVHRALPNSKLVIVEEAGHSETEDGITRALLEAVAAFED